jgi:hypothetical protein
MVKVLGIRAWPSFRSSQLHCVIANCSKQHFAFLEELGLTLVRASSDLEAAEDTSTPADIDMDGVSATMSGLRFRFHWSSLSSCSHEFSFYRTQSRLSNVHNFLTANAMLFRYVATHRHLWSFEFHTACRKVDPQLLVAQVALVYRFSRSAMPTSSPLFPPLMPFGTHLQLPAVPL